MKCLTFLVPIYNEGRLLTSLLTKLNEISPMLENSKILVIDDGSHDNSLQILKSQDSIEFYALPHNLGKGGAIRKGLELINTPFVGVYDGDLEYDPYILLTLDSLVTNLDENKTAVFASRYLDGKLYKNVFSKNQNLSSILMNKVLVLLYLLLFRVRLSDPLTGVKIYPTQFLKELNLNRNGFDGDHEIAIHLVRKEIQIIEVPVEYTPRTKSEGKKIGPLDALMAIRTMVYGRFRNEK
jgi:dolichol-phosphate mannosyltransferase